MNTYNSVKESCDIGNIPLNKWFHLTVMVIGKSLDVYINCNLKKRCKLKGIPKLNYGDIYINSWEGFDGLISNVRYWDRAIGFQIKHICEEGPSKVPVLIQVLIHHILLKIIGCQLDFRMQWDFQN